MRIMMLREKKKRERKACFFSNLIPFLKVWLDCCISLKRLCFFVYIANASDLFFSLVDSGRAVFAPSS